MSLIKPPKLNNGDKIATVSLSWGIAGEPDVKWRYDLAVKRLYDLFGLECISAPNSMRGEKYLADNPHARAEDFLWAFENREIKGIISNIGGNDSYRVLSYININRIKDNPKVFIGYSDIMNYHLMCYHAGLSTFYGANLLTSFGEPQGVHPYTAKWFYKTLFETSPIGEIYSPGEFCCDENEYTNHNQVYSYNKCLGYECLQGKGIAQGRLFGGHTGLMDVPPELLSPLFTKDDIILFVEDIVQCANPNELTTFLRWLGEHGVLSKLKGLIFGRFNKFPENPEYKSVIIQVMQEFDQTDLPILYNLPFGHTSPICVLPYTAAVEIDCKNVRFSILESGVV